MGENLLPLFRVHLHEDFSVDPPVKCDYFLRFFFSRRGQADQFDPGVIRIIDTRCKTLLNQSIGNFGNPASRSHAYGVRLGGISAVDGVEQTITGSICRRGWACREGRFSVPVMF